MAVAGKVMSKRGVRCFAADEMEGGNGAYGSHARKVAPKPDERAEGPTSTTQATKGAAKARAGSIASTADLESRSGLCRDSGNNANNNEPSTKLSSSTLVLPSPKVLEDQANSVSTGPYPVNFGVVVPGVYRSSFPQPQNYGALTELGLKTIITLVRRDLSGEYESFITASNIRHYVFDMKGTKKEEIPTKTMRSILGLILDRQNHPLLVHCNHGKHRTGCVVAAVRRLTGWEVSAIIDEYKTYAGPKARDCDIRYITNFDPSTISNFLGQESALHTHHGRSFVRVTLLTSVVLLLWLLSGKKIVSQNPTS